MNDSPIFEGDSLPPKLFVDKKALFKSIAIHHFKKWVIYFLIIALLFIIVFSAIFAPIKLFKFCKMCAWAIIIITIIFLIIFDLFMWYL